MVRVILVMSLPQDLANYVKKASLSPSFMLRQAITEQQKLDSGEILESNASLMAKIQRLTEHISKMMEFINQKGLQNDFLEV